MENVPHFFGEGPCVADHDRNEERIIYRVCNIADVLDKIAAGSPRIEYIGLSNSKLMELPLQFRSGEVSFLGHGCD